jgi:hypothetical protein
VCEVKATHPSDRVVAFEPVANHALKREDLRG